MESAGNVNEKCKGKATLKEMKKDLSKKIDKKVEELRTFNNAEVAVVINIPGENHPRVWPHPTEARDTFSKFLARPESERIANSETPISVLKEEVDRLKKENNDETAQRIISSIYNGKLSIHELDSEQKIMLCSFTDKKIEELRRHIQKLKKEQGAPHSDPALLPSCSNPGKSSGSGEVSCKIIEKGN